jgi:hypothetical protein
LEKTLKIVLPIEIIEVMDKTVELVGFRSRENLAEVAVLRFLDRYRILLKSINQLSTTQ